jgi:lipopolysaccharide export system protein LptA
MKTISRRAGAIVLACAAAAHAETADRDKPINVEADAGRYDDLKQVGVFTGNVRVTKGTIRITGARLDVRTDPEGYEFATVAAPAGGLATFRQRRDPERSGVEEHIEGEAERIEYDAKSQTVRLIARARMRRLENEVPKDELRGNQITLDNRTSQYSVEGGPAAGTPDGRVRAVIAPRSKSPEGDRKAGDGAALEPTRPSARPK